MDTTSAGTGQPGGGAPPSGLRRLAARLSPDISPFRHSREFRLLYTGQAAGFAGLMISFVAMPYQAYQLTRSSLVVGLLSFTELVPLMAAAVLGGALADAL